MSVERNLSDHDYELLSAYLDGVLTDSERMTLERRLASDDRLRDELEQLYQTVQWIHQLPTLRAPRDFTINAAMVEAADAGAKIIPMPKVKPVRRVASFNYMGIAAAVAIVLFAGILVITMLGPSVGSVFSNVVSSLNSDSASSADGVAVAQNPTLPTVTETSTQPQPQGRSGNEETATTLGDNTDGNGANNGDAQVGAAPPPAPATTADDSRGAVDGEAAVDDATGLDEAESDTGSDLDSATDQTIAPPATFNQSEPAGAADVPPNAGGGVGGQAPNVAAIVTEAPNETMAFGATEVDSAAAETLPEVGMSDSASAERFRSEPELVLRTLFYIVVSVFITLYNLISGSSR